jgi:uncharacterized delta-60 repeat protein
MRLGTVALAASLAFGATSAQAVPGNLDPTFGRGGKVTTPIGSGSNLQALLTQSDGKFVVAGPSWDDGFTVARYTPAGVLDDSFGTDGHVLTKFGPNIDAEAHAAALQADGKLVVGGERSHLYSADAQFALARYLPNGSLDSSFGLVTTAIGYASRIYAVAVRPDKTIIAAGITWNASDTHTDFALARYRPDGSLEGVVTTPLPDDFGVMSIGFQPDRKILLLGYNFDLARFEPDGSFDSSFGSAGIARRPTGLHGEYPLGFGLQPDGKIIVAGAYHDRGFDLVRFTARGALDTSFGSGGEVVTELGWYSEASAVTVQPDGKIVAAGTAQDGAIETFAVARYESNGAADATFGTGGVVVTDLGHWPTIVSGRASALMVQPDGKIVAAGTVETLTGGGSPTFGLARYLVTPGCRVPAVRGKRLGDARAAIVGAGCTVGRIARAYSQNVKRGRVISQHPAPGTGLAEGARVRLVVSKGTRKR